MPEFADSDEEYSVGDIWIEILLQEGKEKAMRCALFVQAQWRFRLLRHKMRVSMEADASDPSLEVFSDISFQCDSESDRLVDELEPNCPCEVQLKCEISKRVVVRRLRDCFAYRRMRWADIKCEGCTLGWADCTCDAPVEKFDHPVQWEHMLQHSSESM